MKISMMGRKRGTIAKAECEKDKAQNVPFLFGVKDFSAKISFSTIPVFVSSFLKHFFFPTLLQKNSVIYTTLDI